MRTSLFAMIVTFALTAMPALAQTVEQPPATEPPVAPAQIQTPAPTTPPAQPDPKVYEGFWGCQMTYTEFAGPDQRISGYVRNFGMLLNPDMTYGIEGNQPGLGNFYGQGKWSADPGGLVLQGQETLPPYPPIPGVVLVFRQDGQGGLTQKVEAPAFGGGYVAQRSLYACQRQQMPQRN